MKGKNTLKLNSDMMLEAVQMWVDSALAAKPRVIGVRQIAPTTYPEPGTPGYYEIDVESVDKPSETPAPFIPATAPR